MVVDLEHLSNEIADIRGKGVSVTPQNFKLSARATISMPWHRIQEDVYKRQISEFAASHPAGRHERSRSLSAGACLLYTSRCV